MSSWCERSLGTVLWPACVHKRLLIAPDFDSLSRLMSTKPTTGTKIISVVSCGVKLELKSFKQFSGFDDR